MKISLMQYDIKWEDKSANLKHIEHLLSGLESGTDLVILPEMFTTGFSGNPEKLFEKPLSSTYKWMLDIAVKGNFGICGSYIVGDGNFFLTAGCL